MTVYIPFRNLVRSGILHIQARPDLATGRYSLLQPLTLAYRVRCAEYRLPSRLWIMGNMGRVRIRTRPQTSWYVLLLLL
jgi:hypothetical protein